MPGERGRSQVRVGAHLLVVGHAEGNDVVVRGQNPAACQFAHSSTGFPLQHGLDLLRHNRSAEHPREGVAHRRLKLALDAVNETHPIACLTRRSSSCLITCLVTRVSCAHSCHIAWYRASARMRDYQNSENRLAAGGGRLGRVGTVGDQGWKFDRLPRLLGRVAEWQTRWLQVPVSFGTWGFKSPFAHNRTAFRPQSPQYAHETGRLPGFLQNSPRPGAKLRI